MFNGCEAFDQDLSNFNMSGVTNTEGMFKGATSFTGIGTGLWDMSKNEVRTSRLNIAHIFLNVRFASVVNLLSLITSLAFALHYHVEFPNDVSKCK